MLAVVAYSEQEDKVEENQRRNRMLFLPSFPTPHRSCARSVCFCAMLEVFVLSGASFERVMRCPISTLAKDIPSTPLDQRWRLEYLPASPKYVPVPVALNSAPQQHARP